MPTFDHTHQYADG